jgi:hypothetical protein
MVVAAALQEWAEWITKPSGSQDLIDYQNPINIGGVFLFKQDNSPSTDFIRIAIGITDCADWLLNMERFTNDALGSILWQDNSPSTDFIWIYGLYRLAFEYGSGLLMIPWDHLRQWNIVAHFISRITQMGS